MNQKYLREMNYGMFLYIINKKKKEIWKLRKTLE